MKNITEREQLLQEIERHIACLEEIDAQNLVPSEIVRTGLTAVIEAGKKLVSIVRKDIKTTHITNLETSAFIFWLTHVEQQLKELQLFSTI